MVQALTERINKLNEENLDLRRQVCNNHLIVKDAVISLNEIFLYTFLRLSYTKN